MEGTNHMGYQYGHKIINEFSVSNLKMAPVYHMQGLLNLRHFNAEGTLDYTISYYLKKFYETFLNCRKVLV